MHKYQTRATCVSGANKSPALTSRHYF